MLRSMTAYGRGECFLHERKIVVEIKSVNHRYNEINIKLPRIMNCFEDKIKKIVNAQAQRGKIDVYINMETFSDKDVVMHVNESLAKTYYEALLKIKHSMLPDSNIPIQLIATFPDVISTEKNVYDEDSLSEIWQTVNKSLEQALEQFVSMRETEGLALKEDIVKKHDFLTYLLKKLTDRLPEISKEYETRLKGRISEFIELNNIEENRVLTEVAIFAEKASVDEEITRLNSHLAQFLQILEENEVVGRKLDFLMQEINREVNTIGSKSVDLEVSKIVVELKSELEKIREQIQNIE